MCTFQYFTYIWSKRTQLRIAFILNKPDQSSMTWANLILHNEGASKGDVTCFDLRVAEVNLISEQEGPDWDWGPPSPNMQDPVDWISSLTANIKYLRWVHPIWKTNIENQNFKYFRQLLSIWNQICYWNYLQYHFFLADFAKETQLIGCDCWNVIWLW